MQILDNERRLCDEEFSGRCIVAVTSDNLLPFFLHSSRLIKAYKNSNLSTFCTVHNTNSVSYIRYSIHFKVLFLPNNSNYKYRSRIRTSKVAAFIKPRPNHRNFATLWILLTRRMKLWIGISQQYFRRAMCRMLRIKHIGI